MPASLTERDLVLLLKKGDQKAFERLYNQYKYPISIKLLKFVKAESLAEDLLHDLFIRIWDNRLTLDPDKSFKSYLYRVAENLVIDFFRKAALDDKFRQYVWQHADIGYSHIEELLQDKENKQLLHSLLSLLSPQCRQVFKLCKLEGRTYEEVALQLQISPNTISNHLVKANKLIRNYLRSEKNLAFLILSIYLLGN